MSAELAPFFGESGSSPPTYSPTDPRLPTNVRDRIRVDPETGCWIWTAGRSQSGYGRVWVAGRMMQAHRVTHELLRGSLTPGLVLDHVACDNPACCNPAHVQQVTQQENIARGWARVRAGLAPSTDEAGRRGPAKQKRDSARQARLIASGRCEACGSAPLFIKRRCAACAKKAADIVARRRSELVARGLCRSGCGRPITPGSKSCCKSCRAKRNERRRAMRAAKKREVAA